MEKFNIKIVISFLLLILVSCQIQNEKFDSVSWNKRTDMSYDNRNKMIADYAIMQIVNDTVDKRFGVIHYHSEGLREEGIPMFIRELNSEKLN